MLITKIEMTAEHAMRLLEKNSMNRQVLSSCVKTLADALRRGQWKFNGDAIRVSSKGQLLDGQHRLLACVETGIPFETILITGLADNVFTTIDTGRKRTQGDILSIEKIPYANTVAASVRWILSIRAGTDRSALSISNSDMLAFVLDNPAVVESVHFCSSHRNPIVSDSIMTAIHFIASTSDREAAEKFIIDIALGTALEPGDPVLSVRNRLIARKTSKLKAVIPQREVVAMLIRAWNARKQNQKKIRSVGSMASPKTGQILFPRMEL